MKKRVILFTLLGLLITCLIVKADDLTNCKTIFDGKCYDGNLNAIMNENKCRTMQEGTCIEYYNAPPVTNQYVQVEPKKDMRYLNKKEEIKVCYDSFGFSYLLDQYAPSMTAYYGRAPKVFITNVEPNSPASKAGLRVGDQIISINGTKVKKFVDADFDKYLNAQQNINLKIKTIDRDNKSVTLSKAEMCKTKMVEPFFDMYWEQISTYDVDYVSEEFSYMSRLFNKLTPQFKRDYFQVEETLNNWKSRKIKFRNAFEMCLVNNYNENDVNNCLNQLVYRSLDGVRHSENIEMQKSQQRLQQYQIDAINDYADALRNQNVNVYTNVHHSGTVNSNIQHSGTVNVNSNVNMNVHGQYYHHW